MSQWFEVVNTQYQINIIPLGGRKTTDKKDHGNQWLC